MKFIKIKLTFDFLFPFVSEEDWQNEKGGRNQQTDQGKFFIQDNT